MKLDLSLFKKTRHTVQERIRTIESQLGELRRERDRTLAAPAHRGDIKAALSGWVEHRRSVYMADLAATLSRHVRSPERFGPLGPAHGAFSLVNASNPFGGVGTSPSADDIDGALCVALGPQILQALTQAVENITWPAPEGLPWAERPAAMAKLDEQISQLTIERNELLLEAEDAGLNLETNQFV